VTPPRPVVTPPRPVIAPLPYPPTSIKKTPTVTTIIDPTIARLIVAAWNGAINYAINEFRKKNYPLTRSQALALISMSFTDASSFAPGEAAVPPLDALNSPSPWAVYTVAQVDQRLTAAFNAALREVNNYTSDPERLAVLKKRPGMAPMAGWFHGPFVTIL
jgi:hypothetical protein